jgi:KaiC/GvpD/RAD55 family RecA-like ATPase
VTVEAVREEWLVEDRWWTPEPLRRHYFEIALGDGRALTVFRTARAQRWYRQRA